MSTPSRPVSGFVPLSKVSTGVELPGGRVLTPRLATLQARHHFTMLDQVTQLVGASETDADLGFMARLLTLCSLPRTNPGQQKEYKRVNGPFTLYMIAGGGNKLPYGNFPRLLLAWVCTEAVRTQSRGHCQVAGECPNSEPNMLSREKLSTATAWGLDTAVSLKLTIPSGTLELSNEYRAGSIRC